MIAHRALRARDGLCLACDQPRHGGGFCADHAAARGHVVSMRLGSNPDAGVAVSTAACECGWTSSKAFPRDAMPEESRAIYADQDAEIIAHWLAVSAPTGTTG